jgi:hypothetical protein
MLDNLVSLAVVSILHNGKLASYTSDNFLYSHSDFFNLTSTTSEVITKKDSAFISVTN